MSDEIVYLNIEMPFGNELGNVHAKGTKAVIMDTQDYSGGIGGQLLYVEFSNGVRTWLHEQWFDKK
jgi:hypothetical protein